MNNILLGNKSFEYHQTKLDKAKLPVCIRITSRQALFIKKNRINLSFFVRDKLQEYMEES